MSQLYRFLEDGESFAEGDIIVRTASTTGPQVAYPPAVLRPVNGYVIDGVEPCQTVKDAKGWLIRRHHDGEDCWLKPDVAERHALRILAAVAKVRAS